MIEAVFIYQTSAFILVISNMGLDRPGFSLKLYYLLLADLIRGKLVLEFIMGEVELNLFTFNGHFDQIQVKDGVYFMTDIGFHEMNLNRITCDLIRDDFPTAEAYSSDILVLHLSSFEFLQLFLI